MHPVHMNFTSDILRLLAGFLSFLFWRASLYRGLLELHLRTRKALSNVREAAALVQHIHDIAYALDLDLLGTCRKAHLPNLISTNMAKVLIGYVTIRG